MNKKLKQLVLFLMQILIKKKRENEAKISTKIFNKKLAFFFNLIENEKKKI